MPERAVRNSSGARQDGGAPPKTPRWVKVGALIGVLVVLVVVALLIFGGGGHGPGRHFGGEIPSAIAPDAGTHQARADGH